MQGERAAEETGKRVRKRTDGSSMSENGGLFDQAKENFEREIEIKRSIACWLVDVFFFFFFFFF